MQVLHTLDALNDSGFHFLIYLYDFFQDNYLQKDIFRYLDDFLIYCQDLNSYKDFTWLFIKTKTFLRNNLG